MFWIWGAQHEDIQGEGEEELVGEQKKRGLNYRSEIGGGKEPTATKMAGLTVLKGEMEKHDGGEEGEGGTEVEKQKKR